MKLYLPRTRQASEPTAEPTLDDLPLGQGEMLLVIEDNSDVRALAVSMLDGLGYQVIDVPETASARAVLDRGEKVDLVISDIVLPGDQSGLEFAEEARDRYPGIKIIFMSGFPAEAARRDGLIGSDRVLLNKPFRMRELARALRVELDRRT